MVGAGALAPNMTVDIAEVAPLPIASCEAAAGTHSEPLGRGSAGNLLVLRWFGDCRIERGREAAPRQVWDQQCGCAPILVAQHRNL
jgi:hypothetical protein